MTQNWLPIAMGVLPEMPCDVTCLRDDGGQLRITLHEVLEEGLSVCMSVTDARKGLRLTIPVEKAERGGYSVGCTIEEVYFLGGLDSNAVLSVEEVLRRKPYRLKERIRTDSTAALELLPTAKRPRRTALVGRMLDISASGVGLHIDCPLDVGDKLSIDVNVHGVHVVGEIVVVQSTKAAFGRWRIGCQFAMLPIATQHEIDAIAVPSPAVPPHPSQGRIYPHA